MFDVNDAHEILFLGFMGNMLPKLFFQTPSLSRGGGGRGWKRNGFTSWKKACVLLSPQGGTVGTQNPQPPERAADTGGSDLIAVINAAVIIIFMICLKTDTQP